MLAGVVSFVGFTFVGPSEVFSMPDSLILMTIGQAVTGASTAIMIIPGLSEMIDSQKDSYPPHLMPQINNTASGAYNAFLAFGQVIAPPFASFMNERFGFRVTVDTVAFSCLAFSLLYYWLGSGSEAIRVTLSNKRNPEIDVDC